MSTQQHQQQIPLLSAVASGPIEAASSAGLDKLAQGESPDGPEVGYGFSAPPYFHKFLLFTDNHYFLARMFSNLMRVRNNDCPAVCLFQNSVRIMPNQKTGELFRKRNLATRR